jgi:hypothetical protein
VWNLIFEWDWFFWSYREATVTGHVIGLAILIEPRSSLITLIFVWIAHTSYQHSLIVWFHEFHQFCGSCDRPWCNMVINNVNSWLSQMTSMWNFQEFWVNIVFEFWHFYKVKCVILYWRFPWTMVRDVWIGDAGDSKFHIKLSLSVILFAIPRVFTLTSLIVLICHYHHPKLRTAD